MKKLIPALISLMMLINISNAQQICTAGFVYSIGNTTPNGTLVSFYDSSSTVGNLTGWSWTASNGQTSTLQDPLFAFNTPGSYQVCLTITAMYQNQLCTSTFCDSIFISSPGTCNASFTYNATTQGVQFAGSLGSNVTWQWSYGDGTAGTGATPFHAYSAPGTYPVCLTVTTSNGLTCTSCTNVTVPSGSCNAAFTPSQNPGTTGFTFTNNSTGNPQYFSWTFGDGSTSNLENPVHTYNGPGVYVVCLNISDSLQLCNDTYCDTVQVGAVSTCTALFSAAQPQNSSIQFSNLSSGNYTSVLWTFGDGSTSTQLNPSHTYLNPGTYNVCVIISDSSQQCYDMYCANVTIPGSNGCQAYFIASGNPAGGNTILFTDNSQGSPSAWYWDFGDGSSSSLQNPNHTYAQPGNYIVCLTIGAAGTTCFDTYCDTITVGNIIPCVPVFSWVEDSLNIGSGTVILQVLDSCGGTITWTFGDGTAGSGSGTSHQFGSSGWYWVCATVNIQGITQTFCDSVYSNRTTGLFDQGSDIFNISAFPNPSSDNLTLQFNSNSENIVAIQIASLTGQSKYNSTVKTEKYIKNQVKLSVADWSAGMYLVTIKMNNKLFHQKFLVQ